MREDEKSIYDSYCKHAHALCMSLQFEQVQAVIHKGKESIKQDAFNDTFKKLEHSIFLYKVHSHNLENCPKEIIYMIGLKLGASNNHDAHTMLLSSMHKAELKKEISKGFEDGKSIGIIAEIRDGKSEGFSR
jgi:hypothetical protein